MGKSSTPKLWSLVLKLCLQMQDVSAAQAKRKHTAQAIFKKPVTRSQKASASKDSVSGNRPGTP